MTSSARGPAGAGSWPQPPGWPPEIVPPDPSPPRRPTVYPPVPVVYDNGSRSMRDDLLERLLERRIVLASGRLDDASATEIAARLMYLDGSGDSAIELRYSCSDGDLGAAVMLADTVELLGVELRATAAGAVGGPAVLPYAVASRRIAHPHAAFTLVDPELEVRGSVTDIVAGADRHASLVADLHARLAAATGQSASLIESDFAKHRLLTADEARDYGLVDEVIRTRTSGR